MRPWLPRWVLKSRHLKKNLLKEEGKKLTKPHGANLSPRQTSLYKVSVAADINIPNHLLSGKDLPLVSSVSLLRASGTRAKAASDSTHTIPAADTGKMGGGAVGWWDKHRPFFKTCL